MKLVDIILIILALLSLSVALLYLFGNSPTFEQSILLLTLTLLFTIGIKITQISTKLSLLDKSFTHLAKDFKLHIKHK